MKKAKRKAPGRLEKERGIWVIRTDKNLPASIVNRTIRQVRKEREMFLLGEYPINRAASKCKNRN